MPSYTYRDEETGHIVDHVQSIFEDLPAEFEIDGRVYRRVFEPVSVIYGCLGFYNTDNRDGIERWRKENIGKGD
jgi:predicted nucleic acid-binding Zn ribbon protein